MGQSLFADPLSALRLLHERSWYEGSHWQPLDFFGSLPPDVPIGTAGSIPRLHAEDPASGRVQEAAKPDVWPLLVDPTSTLDPNPQQQGTRIPVNATFFDLLGIDSHAVAGAGDTARTLAGSTSPH